ncbi:MAG: BamA/TamA family outer membrane protein [Alphaproteobacteria bacterium]|nr:BamA/TamA family outer membrane protein [Alphaproteobacteria bacterium]
MTYEPHIQGVSDSKLLSTLKGLSQLFTLKDKPPDTVAGLDQRARSDVDKLLPAVQGAGYWEAQLDYTVDEAASPVSVTVAVRPGPLYRLATVELVAPGGGALPSLADNSPVAFGLKPGGPALTADVTGAESRIVEHYANEGRPFAKVTTRKVVLDRATKTMAVTYTVDAGPQVRFGPHTITGLVLLDAGYVERRVKWRDGDIYDARLVAATRKALTDSGLFASARIDVAPAGADGEAVPMTIVLVERVRHSVGAVLFYDTTEGIGSRAFWEERNVFGNGENLRLQGQVAQDLFQGLARFRKPDVLDTDQDWLSEAELADERPDPYESRRLRLYSGLERHTDPRQQFGGGLQFQTASVTQNALFDSVPSHVDYTLMGAPLYAKFDESDDKLNPTRGHREQLTITPNAHLAGVNVNFATLQAKVSGYQRLDADSRYVLAGFGGIGSIVGASTERLPADQRLYVGGGGSVRGFGYQRAGPLASGDLPTGGTSSIEFGAELRVKITETIGIVPFFDAGSAYRKTLPDPGSHLFYGAGIGGRYYTPIGPLRLDIAFPINRRPSDSAFQLYISIGQAF